MKFTKIMACTSLALLVFSTFAAASTHEKLVSKYIELSGIEEILYSFPEQLEQTANQKSLTSTNPERDQKVVEILKSAFDSSKAENELYLYLLDHTNPQHLSDMIDWLESPLGRKIKMYEVESSLPQEQANMLRYIADLQADPPSQERIILLNTLEEVSQTSELVATITIDMIKGMIWAIGKTLPEEEQLNIQEAEEKIVEMKPVIKSSLRQQMVIASFYTYRDITNEELEKYIALYQSDAGKAEIEIVGAAISKVMTSWLSNAGETIVAYVEEEKKKQAN